MPEAGRGLDRVSHRLDAGAMAFDARQVPLRRPSAIAVHDDGDVSGQPLSGNLTHEAFVRISVRNRRQQLVKRHVANP